MTPVCRSRSNTITWTVASAAALLYFVTSLVAVLGAFLWVGIWLESPIASWIRGNSVQRKVGCNSCFLKFFCGGGCFAQTYFDYELRTGSGCIMAPDPYCEPYKTQLLELMWDLATEGLDGTDDALPRIYRTMRDDLQSCAASGNKVLDAAFDVGTYHCACVLSMDAK